jgi:hypothetical protein
MGFGELFLVILFLISASEAIDSLCYLFRIKKHVYTSVNGEIFSFCGAFIGMIGWGWFCISLMTNGDFYANLFSIILNLK